MRKFKAESKKLLDMMVNSIYTNKEIFLRELISNASDSLDKLYVTSLENKDNTITRGDLKIKVAVDKDARTLTISDNGIGMTAEELEKNLGTIAHSGSLDFKNSEDKDLEKVDIIGQFGVGFYSSFMVADHVEVISKAYSSDTANKWESDGVEGFTVSEAQRDERGTDVILHIREDDDDSSFDRYLNINAIRNLVKRYSDYIRYPIQGDIEKSRELPKPEDAGDDYTPQYEHYTETETFNSMIPIWTKKKSEVTDEELNEFYKDHFHDSDDPLCTISLHAEGTVSYDALLFVPKNPPVDLYSKDFKRGVALYSNNVMIMEKCEDLLPDCFGFVRGVVDSPDLNLNISRELLQHDRQLKAIEHRIEKKVKAELEKLLKDEREKYEDFFGKFGHGFKFAIYNTFGAQKGLLEDLLLFYSAKFEKPITLSEYLDNMKNDQEEIYYAYGDTVNRLSKSPNVTSALAKDFDVLLCPDNIDEFCLMSIGEYNEKKFHNVSDEALDFGSEEEKEEAKKSDEDNSALFETMKGALGDEVTKVVTSTRLSDAACCITADGPVSLGMEKYLKNFPDAQDKPEAKHILEINPKHAIFETLKNAQAAGETEKIETYAKILYDQALLAEGLDIADPAAYSEAILSLMK